MFDFLYQDDPNEEKPNYLYLILVHVVCADYQIHGLEVAELFKFEKTLTLGDSSRRERDKILSSDPSGLSLEEVARQIPPEKHQVALEKMLAIAYCDGTFSPLEKQMIEKVAKLWTWSSSKLDRFIRENQNQFIRPTRSIIQEKQNITLWSSILRNVHPVISNSWLTKIASYTPLGGLVKNLQFQSGLVAGDYEDTVSQCATISQENYQKIENILQTVITELNRFNQNLLSSYQKTISDKNQASVNQLQHNFELLTDQLHKYLELLHQGIISKQRAQNQFTISFIGKKHVGKKTLQEFITKEEWRDLTCEQTNKIHWVSSWQGIRLIQTPSMSEIEGYQAPDIINSVINETDLFCYIIKDHDIKEEDFKILTQLREQNKPLIILVNIHSDVQNHQEVEDYLKQSSSMLKNINPVLEKIRLYAMTYYKSDYFKIIPVMLLSAELATDNQGINNYRIFQMSRVENLLDEIRMIMINQGKIRRSQTLLGSSVNLIQPIQTWIEIQQKLLADLTQKFSVLATDYQDELKSLGQEYLFYLLIEIDEIFEELMKSLPDLTDQFWEFSEEKLRTTWQLKLKDLKLEQRLKLSYYGYCHKFNQSVQQIFDNLTHQINTLVKESKGIFELSENSANIYDQGLEVTAGDFLNHISDEIVMDFKPPVNEAVWLLAGLYNKGIGLFKTPEEKNNDAIPRLQNLLGSQITRSQERTLNEIKEEFTNYYQNAANLVGQYFSELSEVLKEMSAQFENPKKRLLNAIDQINRAYAKRVIDWCLERDESLTEANIVKTIAKVERTVGNTLTVQTKYEIQSQKTTEEILKVLQEDLLTHRIK